MSFDALTMMAVRAELESTLLHSPVQRVDEPENNIFLFNHYTGSGQSNLLVSIDPRYARIHLSSRRFKKMKDPSPLCMLLRKYLTGARPVSFFCPPQERIIDISYHPSAGMPAVRLVVELMGRRSNLILVSEDGLVLGAAKRSTYDQNQHRDLIPGAKYSQAPDQEKLDPVEMSWNDFANSYSNLLNSGKNREQALVSAVKGLSPLLAREILYRSEEKVGNKEAYREVLPEENSGDSSAVFNEVRSLFTEASGGIFLPCVDFEGKRFAVTRLNHINHEKLTSFQGVSVMLDSFYTGYEASARNSEKRTMLKKAVEKKVFSLDKKKNKQKEEINAADNASHYQLYGDTLLTYREKVPRGADSIALPHLYNPGEKLLISLDPSKNLSVNIQLYYKRYRRARAGQGKIRQQLRTTEIELDYCRDLLYSIEYSSDADLDEIMDEMIDSGLLRKRIKKSRSRSNKPTPPVYKASSGQAIYVGQNNRQNDHITFKIAVRKDLWFHVKDLPGSHVLLKTAGEKQFIPNIEEAAFLAAYFSKGKNSSAVSVDYTEIRHVRRRPGGKPGAVFYENYNTITVNPGNVELVALFGLT